MTFGTLLSLTCEVITPRYDTIALIISSLLTISLLCSTSKKMILLCGMCLVTSFFTQDSTSLDESPTVSVHRPWQRTCAWASHGGHFSTLLPTDFTNALSELLCGLHFSSALCLLKIHSSEQWRRLGTLAAQQITLIIKTRDEMRIREDCTLPPASAASADQDGRVPPAEYTNICNSMHVTINMSVAVLLVLELATLNSSYMHV